MGCAVSLSIQAWKIEECQGTISFPTECQCPAGKWFRVPSISKGCIKLLTGRGLMAAVLLTRPKQVLSLFRGTET